MSIDPVEQNAETRAQLGADFDFLADPDGRLMDVMGLRHAHGRADGADIFQSASVLLDASGRILWSKVAENYRVRPRPAEILAAYDSRAR